jgi:hypothetical protein
MFRGSKVQGSEIRGSKVQRFGVQRFRSSGFKGSEFGVKPSRWSPEAAGFIEDETFRVPIHI